MAGDPRMRECEGGRVVGLCFLVCQRRSVVRFVASFVRFGFFSRLWRESGDLRLVIKERSLVLGSVFIFIGLTLNFFLPSSILPDPHRFSPSISILHPSSLIPPSLFTSTKIVIPWMSIPMSIPIPIPIPISMRLHFEPKHQSPHHHHHHHHRRRRRCPRHHQHPTPTPSPTPHPHPHHLTIRFFLLIVRRRVLPLILRRQLPFLLLPFLILVLVLMLELSHRHPPPPPPPHRPRHRPRRRCCPLRHFCHLILILRIRLFCRVTLVSMNFVV